MTLRKTALLLAFAATSLAAVVSAVAQGKDDGKLSAGAGGWSVRMANAVMTRLPHYLTCDSSMSWNYEEGVLLQSIWDVWEETGDSAYFDYVRRSLDYYVTDSGDIRTYDMAKFRLDDITPGRVLLELYSATNDIKYKRAAFLLRNQLRDQPRIREGGFWHKKIYPSQMWLDGLYMAEPFYAKFATMFDQPSDLKDVASQFVIMADHAEDSSTGLFYHAWDASLMQKWANPKTGDSPTFWGRSMGWYMMGIVDVLDYFPRENPERTELIDILRGLSASLLRYQDAGTGLWYQVVDRPGARGNYLESSASAMFAYAFAKGEREGYLNKRYLEAAERAFHGLVSHEILIDQRGLPTLTNICGGTGLGGRPYRDGSYDYYVSVPRKDNDFKGVGPFIMAAVEIGKAGRRR